MEKEISSGTMLGIVLIALAAVIGLGFGVFSIAKGVANNGVVNVQDNLGTVAESAFEDFDQKVVTGTQVTSAYKQFTGKAVAILINTQAMNKNVKTSQDHAKAYVFKIGNKPYINYNALLAIDAAGTHAVTANGGTGIETAGSAGLVLKDGVVTTGFGFALNADDGKILVDSSIGGFAKAGNCEFISASAKFEANLVRDASGTTVGVVFTQLPR